MHLRKLRRKKSRLLGHLHWSASLFWISCSLWAVEGEEVKEVEPLLVEEAVQDLSDLSALDSSIPEEELIALNPEWAKKVKLGWATTKETPAPPPLASQNAPHFGLDLDLLYFEPVQMGLKYGQTNSMSFNPPGRDIDQPFTYKLGFRANLNIPISYENWGVNFTYTYFHPTMPSVHKVDPNQFLYMVLAQSYFPQVNNFYNVQCGELKGNWRLRMDVLNADLKKTWMVDRSFVIKPSMGIQAASVKERMVVQYRNLWIINGSINDVPIVNPQKIISNSEVYGIGPELGTELQFLIPSNVIISFKSLFSCMFGVFENTTKGTDSLGSFGSLDLPGGITTTPYPYDQILKNRVTGSFTMMQIQAAISKESKMGKKGSCLFMVGWETQFWWSLHLMNGFNEPDLTSLGADLSLQGPFFRIEGNF